MDKYIPLNDIAIVFSDLKTHRTGENKFNYYDICTFGSVGSNSVVGIPS